MVVNIGDGALHNFRIDGLYDLACMFDYLYAELNIICDNVCK